MAHYTPHLSRDMENVLGISLGTRSMGFVFLHQSELYHWGIKTYKGKWSNKKLKRILHVVDTLIAVNGITGIAVKIPDNLPISKGFMQLVGSLNVLFEAKRIQAKYLSLSDLKQHYCGIREANKARLIQLLLEKYPDLNIIGKRQSKNRNYYLKIYEAFAAANYY